MIYLKTKDTTNGITQDNIFYCWGDVHRATFSPDVERVALVEFKTHGKTYEERRENLRQIALDFSSACTGDLYYTDAENIITWFEKNATRYGLVRDFKKNGII